MAGSNSAYIPARMPTTRAATPRLSRATGWLIAGLLAVLLVVLYVWHERVTRPTVLKVAGLGGATFDSNERQALGRFVDGLGFPQHAAGGFRAIGGTTFEIDGRAGATVVWARDEQRINYTIVAGTDHIDTEYPWVVRNVKVRGESRDLYWVTDGLMTFKRNGRTVVMTGSPPSERLRRVMRELATSI